MTCCAEWAGFQADAHPIDAAIGRFQHFELQPILFEDFTSLGNVSGQFADQSGNGRGVFLIRTNAQQLLDQVEVGVAVEDIRSVALFHDFGLLVLVANLADNLFNQVFNGDQTADAAVLVDRDGHADVVALHLAQQIAAQLGLGHKAEIGLHDVAHGFRGCFLVGELQQVLGEDDSLDVIEIAFIDRNPRVRDTC